MASQAYYGLGDRTKIQLGVITEDTKHNSGDQGQGTSRESGNNDSTQVQWKFDFP